MLLISQALNIDVSDDKNFINNIFERLFVKHNLFLSGMLALLLLYVTLRYSFMEILMLIFSKFKSKSKTINKLVKNYNDILQGK